MYSKYFNCNTDNILHFHVNFQQHSVAFIRLLPQYYKNKVWRAGLSWIFRARKAWWSHLQARRRSLRAC